MDKNHISGNMKTLLILFLGFISLTLSGQEAETGFDGHKWKAPYDLPVPEGWAIERFPIPISFAPEIPYKGVEDIRFAPGWGNVKSDEYWTYAFLWYLDSPPETDAKMIAGNLEAYYSGLINSNTDSTRTPALQPIPVAASFKEITKDDGDLGTFEGTIKMMDYMQQKPIVLNCIAHLKVCPENNKTLLFFELSPKPFSHGNWIGLDNLWKEFKCTNR